MDPAEYTSQSLFTSQAILTLGFSGMDPYAALAAPMPLWQILAASAFVYALSIFYLPNYQCVQLAYFDAAKEDMPEFRSRQSDFSDARAVSEFSF